jgi:crooked neck
MSRAPQVKNRSAAAIQITAEQLLRIAHNQGIERVEKAPTQFITDREELLQYQQTKRKDFEDQLRRSRQHIGIWCKYGLWEASQKEYERARSVFERALDVDYRNQTLWLKYADMEMKNKFVNHARNVWDRAVTLHPRIDSFWYKYSYMEEMVGAIDNARQVFERWMQWEPDEMSWAAYIKFEMRQEQVERARAIYERFIALLPTCKAYLKYARWEEKLHQKALARGIYERSLVELHPQERTEKLLVNFARFEERCKETERARVIYQYALDQLEGGDCGEEVSELKKEFIAFEKRHGSKTSIESAIVAQRRQHYNALVAEDVYNYDAWFDFIKLEESESEVSSVREVFDRAVACVPPVKEKRFWRRYIYLWINYALFEELTAKDLARTREVYRKCLEVVPHKLFTFGKIWLMAAHFEVRQRDLTAARKLLGRGIGKPNSSYIVSSFSKLKSFCLTTA